MLEELLRSTTPAQLAYSGLDGKPRVVPIWFHWTGEEVVLGTPPKAPKVEALRKHGEVAISIDGDAQLRQMGQQKMVRISVRPRWVGILDFVTRFPKALS